MSDERRAARIREARAAWAARRETSRPAASPRKDASPQAVESVLASISEEVTAEAIERQRNKGKPC
jgi:hypothetical protein